MYQSIIYKEWIKTRKAIAILFVIFAGVGIYTFMSISQSIRLSGAVSIWETILQKDTVLFPFFRFLPLMAGILLAVMQYIPEMHNKRLKLSLHLPLPETGIISAMLLYGFVILLFLLLLTMTILLICLGSYFAKEIVFTTFWGILPWFLAGFAAYFLSAWICLEPVWKQRICNAIPSICALSFFFIGAKQGSFQTFISYLICFTAITFLFSFYSTARFKDGVQ